MTHINFKNIQTRGRVYKFLLRGSPHRGDGYRQSNTTPLVTILWNYLQY